FITLKTLFLYINTNVLINNTKVLHCVTYYITFVLQFNTHKMRAIYDFTNKSGQSKARFLQNEWAKFYRRKFTSYHRYLAAMESKAILNEETQTYQFANKG